MLTSIVAGMLKKLYSAKTKNIYKNIELTDKEFQELLKKLEKEKEELDNLLDDPSTILAFKSQGVDITDWPRFSNRGRQRDKNLLFKKGKKYLV